MQTRTDQRARPGRARRLLATLALAGLTTSGALVAAAPAAAQDFPIIPPNGWCHEDFYGAITHHGTVHQRHGSTQQRTNHSSIPVNFTFVSGTGMTLSSSWNPTTVPHDPFIPGQVQWPAIQSAVQFATGKSVAQSVHVSTSHIVTVPNVPPGATVFAEFGAFREHTTGNYTQDQFECGTFNFHTWTTVQLTAFSISDVGWRVWID